MGTTSPATGYTAPTLWYVRSDTDPTHYYAVSTDARGLLRCECKSAQYRRTPCKHVRQVVAGSVRPATVKARAETAPVSVYRTQIDATDLYSDAGAAIERSVAQFRRTRDGSRIVEGWGREAAS